MYPLPEREQERLAVLKSTGILESGPLAELDAIVEHVRDLFNIPICLVSLVDADYQWFKANCGLPAEGTSRDVSFCAHAILGRDLFVIEDAHQDPRFAENPLVTGDPYIRFYAGAPLEVSPGIALGSLCVIDRVPRKITAAERLTLKRLACVVTGIVRSHGMANEAMVLAQKIEAQSFILEIQQRELRLRERRFLQTEAIARIGGWEVDLVASQVSWSDEIYRIYDLAIGTPIDLDIAFSIYLPAERQRLEQMVERTLRDGIPFDDEFEIETARGQRKWVRGLGDVEYVDGEARRLFGTFQDVSEKYREQQRLWDIANHDALTGLANRRRFNQLVGETFSVPGARPGLLMIDADHLKVVNDTLGHEAGDALIQCIAARLQAVNPTAATVARIGGDEFAVLFDDSSVEQLAQQAAASLAAISEPIAVLDVVIQPQVSIGGAMVDGDEGIDGLRRHADIALYRAKETQRGSYVPFSPALGQALSSRARVLSLKTRD